MKRGLGEIRDHWVSAPLMNVKFVNVSSLLKLVSGSGGTSLLCIVRLVCQSRVEITL